MSKQTNPFQQLIAMIVGMLDDGVVLVEESKEFPDPDTGVDREVDVYALIEGKLDGRVIRIAAECVDRSRKMDAPWVEGIHGKHSRLQVADIVLLVSKSGFYTPAVKKAKAFGYRTIHPAISEKTLTRELRLADDLKMSMKVMMCNFGETTLNSNAPGEGYQWPGEKMFLRADGTELVSLEEWRGNAVFAELAKDGAPLVMESGASERNLTFTVDDPSHDGERLHILLRSPDGEIEVITALTSVTCRATIEASERADFEQTQEVEFAGQVFTTGTSTLDGKPARMVITEPPGGGFKAKAQVSYCVKEHPDKQGKKAVKRTAARKAVKRTKAK